MTSRRCFYIILLYYIVRVALYKLKYHTRSIYISQLHADPN